MITTECTEFVGAHLTKAEKDKLRDLSNKNGPIRRSMSKIIRNAVRRELQNEGYELPPEQE